MRGVQLGIVIVALVFALFGAEARADVVGSPPDDCTEGTQGTTCHGGPYCQPRACTTDTDCDGGATCKELPLCTGTINCAGHIPSNANPHDYDQPKIEGACPNGNECTAGAVCQKQKVCVGGTSDSGAHSSATAGGCACNKAGGSSASAALGAAAFGLGLSVVLRSRRRQGRASRHRRA
jgi:hypothetical protein